MTTISLTPDKHCKVKSPSVFKSIDAYRDSETLVCYIDRDGNSYTKADFMKLAGGNTHLSQFLFDTVITKSPAAVIAMWKDKGELPF
jgi:hypothetical protein